MNVPAPREEREPRNVLQLIGALARDPEVSVEKMQAILTMQRTIAGDEARKAFIRAKIKMRPNLPRVKRSGMIEIYDKNDKRKLLQSTPFAKFEDIHEAVFPVLLAHGFDLDFRTGTREGRPFVTAVLMHKDGHTEETTLEGPIDSSGSKNNVQGVGSTVSYLKRYTMTALLNIQTSDKGEFDDDGHAAGKLEGPETLSSDQVNEIKGLLTSTQASLSNFLNHVGADSLEDIPAAQFDSMKKLIKEAAERRQSRGR